MTRACLVFILLVWVGLLNHVSGHPEGKQALEEMEEDVEDIKFTVDDMKRSILEVYGVIQTEINKVVLQNEEEKRNAKQAQVIEERIKNIQTRLTNVAHLLGKVERYVSVENQADATLEDLPLVTMEGLEESKVLIKKKIDVAKLEIKTKIDDVDTYLTEVDDAAKSRNVIVSGVQYYGSVGSACSTGKDVCNLPDTECRGGRCQCLLGLSFDSLHRKCVKECSHYGKNYQSAPNYIIRNYNNLIRNDSSFADCKNHCTTETKFECRSFDYFPRWRTCYLSQETKSSVPAESWEYNSAGSYFQRGCSDE